MNSAAQQALDNIRRTVASQERVVFVFHCWHNFNNLAMGFKFPAIPSPTIPRMELIPLVVTEGHHIESKINERSAQLSSIPVTHKYTRHIDDAYTDLLHKFGRFGFTKINALECSINDVDRYMDIFSKMMTGFQGGVLQDLPQYFGVASPVSQLFGPDKKRITTTALAVLDKMNASGFLLEDDYKAFKKAIPEFAQSAVAAHRVALAPTQGVLSRSILWINDGSKDNFDETDQFILTQFPAFNAETRISKKNSTDGIERLADLLAGRLAAPASVVEPEVADVSASVTFEEELDIVENLTPVALVEGKCKALTSTGAQCKRDAEENGFCNHPAHQPEA